MSEQRLDIDKMQECIDRAAVFVNDVLPQARGLAFQDYANINELCILLGQLSDVDKETKRYD